MGLALYASGCAALALFARDPAALVASGVVLPLAATWLILALDGRVVA